MMLSVSLSNGFLTDGIEQDTVKGLFKSCIDLKMVPFDPEQKSRTGAHLKSSIIVTIASFLLT